MSEPKKKHEEKPAEKPEAKTEVPDTKHHYPAQKALEQGPTSQSDALGSTAQS